MSGSAENADALVTRIDACLPQTQCTRCGYPRCRDYAVAVAAGRAGINQCPPGGATTLQALSEVMRLPPTPIDPRFGTYRPRMLAVIDEAACIGCRKCIEVCPVDAIIGAPKRMHTVLTQECNGCELCLPPCPVDCIDLIEHAQSASGSPPSPACGRGNEGEGWPDYTREETERWRARTERRLQRLARRPPRRASTPRERIRAEIHAAVQRVKARKMKNTRAP